MKKDIESLSHTRSKYKYHIVFAPKYRRQNVYGKYKERIEKIIRELCERKNVEIIEANACMVHIHMLVSIPPKLSVSQFIGYLKGKSSSMIFDKHAELKCRYGNRKFWFRGYYVDTVGRNNKQIEEYIRNQLREDYVADQLTLFEEIKPFTGQKNEIALSRSCE
ncbi:IS200/IS605 family transposase [Enterococcus faecalis]|nr:IS200/IS605 family transposase [Enterococcus faecalis]